MALASLAVTMSRTSPVPLFSLQKLVSVRTEGFEPSVTPGPSFIAAEEPKTSSFGSMMASFASISRFAGIGGSGASGLDYSTIPAQISIAAQGGYEGNAYFALYTTNNYLIFRHVGESGVPLVRMMSWFKDPNLKIVGMAFNHSAQWLVCVTSDMSIFVLSIYFMMVRDNMMQPLKVIQTTRYSREKKFHFSDAKCWRSGAGVEYAVITTTPGNVRLVNLSNGEYFKVKAKTGLGKFHILTEPGHAPSTWLIIESPGHGFYRLLIGHYLESGKYEDLASPGASLKQEFQFFTFSASKNPNARLSVQSTPRGPIICIFDPDTKALQIIDSNLRLLYKYSISTALEIKGIPHVTENLIFALTSPPSDASSPCHRLIVLSRIFSEEKSPSNPLYQEFILPAFESVRGLFFPGFNQPFSSSSSSPASVSTSSAKTSSTSSSNLATSSNTKASSPVATTAAPKSVRKQSEMRPKSVRSYVEVSPMSLMLAAKGGSKPGFEAGNQSETSGPSGAQGGGGGGGGGKNQNGNQQGDLFSYARTRGSATGTEAKTENKPVAVSFEENAEEEYEEVYVEAKRVEGLFFWTDDGLYELRAVVSPEEMFFKLIERPERKKQGEELGITFGLDVCKLYELSADEHFRRGELGTAQPLYHLSNVSTPKLIRQWLSVGRMDEPISALRILLAGAKVGEAKRPLVANELIRCHIQRLLNPSKQSNLRKLLNINERSRDDELELFLKNNPDYVEKDVSALFAAYGLIRFCLIVAKAKGHLGASLESLAGMRGISYLSMEHLRFISENNAMEAGTLKTDDANTLLSHFPPSIQLLHYLTAVSNIQNTMPRIQDLLTELDDESLIQICRFFDPQGPFVGPMLHSQNHTPQHQQHTQGQSPGRRRPHEETGAESNAHSSTATNRTKTNGPFVDFKKFVSQCVELFLSALIRLHRNSTALPQSWKRRASSTSINVSGSSLNSSTDLNETEEILEGPENEPALSPRKPASLEQSLDKTQLRGLRPRKAVSAFCGFHHTALLTENGQVFTWGAGSKGQLGHENVSDTLWVPKHVAGLSVASIGEKVWKIACGGNHTMALTQSGQLFAFGSNARGQLGLGDREDRMAPRMVIFDERIRHEMGNIVDLSAGFWHTVLVSDKPGGVWSAGANSSRASTALHSEMGDQLFFSQIPNATNESFTMVRCGFGHTALLTKRGRVYTFGSNENGQLGLGSSVATDVPQLVRGLLDDKHIIDIACGSFATFAVSEVYSVYAWGLGSKNRLGVLAPAERRSAGRPSEPLRPTSPIPRASHPDYDLMASSGYGNGMPQAVAPDQSEDFEETSPVRIDALQGLEIVRVFAGPSHAFATSSSGKVYVWGDCNTPMKVKPSALSNADPRLPTALTPWSDSPIACIGCGDDFSVCILENGLVYTFGRGMCGQLGHNDQHDCWEARQAFLNTSLVVEDLTHGLQGRHMHDESSDASHERDSVLHDSAQPAQSQANYHQSQLSARRSHSREPSYGNLSTHSPLLASVLETPESTLMVSNGSVNSHGTTSEEERGHLPATRIRDLAQSSVLSSSASSMNTYLDPVLLEHSLQVLAKRYRPSVVLHQCIVNSNLSAAALILEQCGAWAASIDCKIRLLRQAFPKMGSDVAYQTHLLTELIKDLVQPNMPEFARQEGLKKLLLLWKQVGASVQTLESLLKGPTLINALAGLLEGPSLSGGASGLSSIDFSAKFMLTVVQAGLEKQRREYSAKRASYSGPPSKSGSSLGFASPAGAKPSSVAGGAKSPPMDSPTSILVKDPAWTERRAYFERDLKVRAKIQISQPALEDFIQHAYPSSDAGRHGSQPKAGTNSSKPTPSRPANGEDANVVFTCGHILSEKRFSQSTIPLFRDKMAKFPVPLPLTIKLLLMDFQSSVCNTACPPCVYNHLREKHAPKLERWNPQ
jgi:alpha-tubulin suppressor-like RCC1 family protein